MGKKSSISFENSASLCAHLRLWWKELDERRGDRAELRRCHSYTNIVFVPAYHSLLWRMNPEWILNKERFAMIAGVTSYVRKDLPDTRFASQLASGEKGNPLLSPLRFRRILSIIDNDELYEAMIRTVKHLKGNVNLCDMAQSIYWWNDSTKKQWAYEYYSKTTIQKQK